MSFSLKDYFPLHPEKISERQHRRDEARREEYRVAMEEIDRRIKNEIQDEPAFTNVRPTHK